MTKHIVIISKPPADSVAATVLERVRRSSKPFTVCFIGARDQAVPPNAKLVPTLTEAAEHALGRSLAVTAPQCGPLSSRSVRGLFAGGTLCAEAQFIGLRAGVAVASNVGIPGAQDAATATPNAHLMLDLGDDAYTQGRPHPMIEPAVRDAPLREALADPNVGAVILDVVLGYGASADPAGHLARALPPQSERRVPLFVSVVGTVGDPQGLATQRATLAAAGIETYTSNAAATRAAFRAVGIDA